MTLSTDSAIADQLKKDPYVSTYKFDLFQFRLKGVKDYKAQNRKVKFREVVSEDVDKSSATSL